MKYFDRRGFLKAGAAAAGVFYIAPTSWAQKSPGDTLNSVVVGFNGRGGAHIGALSGLKDSGVRLAALCDEVWLVVCDEASQLARLEGRGTPAARLSCSGSGRTAPRTRQLYCYA